MVSLQYLTSSIFLAVCYASWASADTLNIRRSSPAVPGFSHKSKLETYGSGVAQEQSISSSSIGDRAKSFASKRAYIDLKSIAYHTGYSSDIVDHAYLRQQHNGVPFANAVANVAFKKGNVVSFGHSFVNATSIASSTPDIPVQAAISKAEAALDGKYNNVPATVEYYVKDDKSVVLTHAMQIRNEQTGAWYEAFVDAHSNELVAAVDFVAKGSYRVVPIVDQSPKEDGFSLLVDPQDTSASPFGWHSTDGHTFTNDTSGNNAVVYLDTDTTNTAKQSSPDLVFDYKQDPASEPTVPVNTNAARTNVFYILNTVHDIAYKYGFTESAFNFQQANGAGSGGVDGDPVFSSVQNSSGLDNADFTTLPDGQSGFMRMFLWDFTTPQRDGALENDIVTHEMTHGITNRMTGGGTARCLQIAEAQGLGEGWSDAMAEWTEHKNATIVDFTLGSYVEDNTSGIRSHPYSTDKTVNPYTYNTLLSLGEVHDIGEVWANMLHNVYAPLVEAYGFSSNAHTDSSGTEGNVVFLHLFLDALPLQPCQPEFVTARDAWIQADQNRYDGKHRCLLWKAFASRGLGPKANDQDYLDDFSVPDDCQ